MESFQDVLDLGSISGQVGTIKPRKDLVAKLKEHSYGNIEQLEAAIEYMEDRQRDGKLRRRNKIKAKAKLPGLRQRLAKLKTGHEKLAVVMRTEAQKLEQLPKEMRLAILEKIYIHPEPIMVMCRRRGAKHHFILPEDESMYLSSAHVGPTIASEAAEIFYKRNCFKFSLWMMHINEMAGLDWLNQFFDKDHYHSGVWPRELLRKVCISFQSPSIPFNPARGHIDWSDSTRHDDFESAYDAVAESERAVRHPRYNWDLSDERVVLQHIVNRLTNLRELLIDLEEPNSFESGMLRLINPMVRHALDKGIETQVMARVRVCGSPDILKEINIISYFAPPSDTDLSVFEKEGQRKSFRIEDDARDPLEVWWKLQDILQGASTWQIGRVNYLSEQNISEPCYRVWLNEHFEYWELRQAHRQLINSFEGMKAEINAAKPESLSHRLRYYVRLLTLMHPTIDGE